MTQARSEAPRTTVITGAGGFIGSHVLDALVENGGEVHALSSRAATAGDGRAHWHQVDLLGDPARLRDCLGEIRATQLLHLAWYAVPGKYQTSLENYRWVSATLELAAAFRDAGGTRMVAAGTCAEYDSSRTDSTPATPYSVSKDATRRLLMSYAGQTGLSAAWGRIFFLYGPREQGERLIPAVVGSLLQGVAPLCTEGLQVRDFLHVTDVARAFVQALDSDIDGPFDIASGQPVTVREVVEQLAGSFPGAAAPRFGAVPSRAEPPYIVGDPTRLSTVTGWRPAYDLQTGLADTVDWWRAR